MAYIEGLDLTKVAERKLDFTKLIQDERLSDEFII